MLSFCDAAGEPPPLGQKRAAMNTQQDPITAKTFVRQSRQRRRGATRRDAKRRWQKPARSPIQPHAPPPDHESRREPADRRWARPERTQSTRNDANTFHQGKGRNQLFNDDESFNNEGYEDEDQYITTPQNRNLAQSQFVQITQNKNG